MAADSTFPNGGPLPGDPVRSLEALHIASAVVLADALGPLSILPLDDRVLAAAIGLGVPVLP